MPEGEQKKKQNWFSKHKILTFIGVLILVGVIYAAGGGGKAATTVSPSSSNNDKSQGKTVEQTTFKVGDAINFDNKKVTVVSAERNWNSGNQFIAPGSGNEFVKVQVNIENDSDNQISYNTFDWKMKDSNGVIKDVASATYSVDGALNSGELAKKGKVSGFLVFEVPSGDAGLVLQYNPTFWTDKKLEINL